MQADSLPAEPQEKVFIKQVSNPIDDCLFCYFKHRPIKLDYLVFNPGETESDKLEDRQGNAVQMEEAHVGRTTP